MDSLFPGPSPLVLQCHAAHADAEVKVGVLVGGSAAIAVLALVFRPKLGAAAAMFSAVMILGLELVEIVTVGFSPRPQSWSQVAYIAVGVVITLIGAGLWWAEGGRNPLVAGSSNRRWMA